MHTGLTKHPNFPAICSLVCICVELHPRAGALNMRQDWLPCPGTDRACLHIDCSIGGVDIWQARCLDAWIQCTWMQWMWSCLRCLWNHTVSPLSAILATSLQSDQHLCRSTLSCGWGTRPTLGTSCTPPLSQNRRLWLRHVQLWSLPLRVCPSHHAFCPSALQPTCETPFPLSRALGFLLEFLTAIWFVAGGSKHRAPAFWVPLVLLTASV